MGSLLVSQGKPVQAIPFFKAFLEVGFSSSQFWYSYIDTLTFVVSCNQYSYNLKDTVRYYELYIDLMHFWYQSYSDHIYNLDYDKLTEDQEPQTLRLIEYLELNWEDACLAPQNNKRSVRTASQQQVRQKVYKGSSEAWRKYEPFLDGVFDGPKA